MLTSSNQTSIHPWWHVTGLIILCAGLVIAAWQKSGQFQYPYPLDDSYIHLAISESWVSHGIPSPEASTLAFSSSSPLYTTILAGLTLFLGAWIYWPLIIGILSGIALTLITYRFLTSSDVKKPGLWLWTVLVLGPVPLLVLLGMEHMLQVVIWSLFFLKVRDLIVNGDEKIWKLVVLSAAVITIRYEGIFLISATALVLWFIGFKKQSIGITLAGMVGVGLIGITSWLNGGTFFPLSLLMKGHLPEATLSSFMIFGNGIIQRLYEHPFILVILTISAVGWAGGNRVSATGRYLSAILQVASWGQIGFAEIGGYRYEAWMVVLHILLLAILIRPYIHDLTWWGIGSFGWLILPLLVRTLFFVVNYPVSVQNIYHQSIQAGSFIQKHLNGEAIAIQDIGAASYLADFQLTDLAGIGDQQVNDLFREKRFGPETVAALLEERSVRYAIIQQAWMGWVIPDSWIAVGCWTTPEAFIVPNAEVFFWAADSVSAKKLTGFLVEYSSDLPEEVAESGPYVGTDLPEVAFLP